MRITQNLKLFAAALIIPVVVASPLQSLAATTPTINTGAKVSFTFDDGYTSALTQAAPTLAKYGMSGTNYVISGCVGMTKAPNTCHADDSKTYMTWAQIQSLQNTYGWEIGAHTVDHYCLASNASVDPDDCQANTMTTAQVDAELANSKAALAANGINATDMATPYGDYNQSVLAEIAKYYATQRGFADTGYNAAPYNQYIIRDQIATGGVSLATLEGDVNTAMANNQWVVFTFHDILAKASNKQSDYEYSTANLDALAAYVKSKSVPVVNVNNGTISGTNLLSNPSFDSSMTGWSTDSPANIVKNSANNGSYPSPTNSIAFSSKATNSHLFSPSVAVNPNSTYVLKNFINLKTITSGSVGYFVDEYNSNGTWISGQYKLNVSFPWPQTVGFEYKPSSANVTSTKLQVIIPANSGATGYLDNFEWIDENPGTPPPPPPVQTNLMPNSTFDAGISQGWTTDGPTNIVADANNNGSPANPVNSAKLTATTVNRHLFSPKITLVSGKTYSVSSYVNIKQLTSGEVGFYIDEYDANGNWISGKYITGARSVGTSTVSFTYTPTSTNVASASLQFILVGNSGIVAYVDNVAWIQN
jgi:peptidoglycan/xylan/chitin deacetylase (PgdA/CDA1 family)